MKLTTAAGISLCLLIAALLNTQAISAPWTQFQANAAHNGRVDEVISPGDLRELWQLNATDTGLASIVPGVVANDHIAYFTGKVSTNSYRVIAVDAFTKAEQWRNSFAPYSPQGLSAPSLGNGEVYVHQWGHSGISGGNSTQYPYLKGINAATGALQFATSHSGQWDAGSRPTVIDQQVFAAGGYYGGIDGYNATTGSKIWSDKVNQQYGWIPAADASKVYVYMGYASASPGPEIGRLYAFDRASGSSAFTIINSEDTRTRNTSPPVVGDVQDVLAFSTVTGGTKIVSFDIPTQTIKWRTTVGKFDGRVALDDGLIYAPNGTELTVLDELTGNRLGGWTAPGGASLTGNVLATDNLVFTQTSTATYAIDRSNLSQVWTAPYSGDLALSNGVLYISNATSIHAFSAVPEPATGVLLCLAMVCAIQRCARRGRV